MSVWPPQGTDVSIRPPRVPTLAKGPHLSGYSKGEHLVLGKSIAHDMKSGAEGAHFFGALLLTFSFDKHMGEDNSFHRYVQVECTLQCKFERRIIS